MAIINPKPGLTDPNLHNKHLIDFQWVAEAYRHILVDSTGTFIDSSNPLPVDLIGSDIQIGAVEIKDETTDVRVNVVSDGTNNAMFVQANSFDIRPLTNVDVVTAEQGTSPWIVNGTDIDIRDLTSIQDNVSIGDDITGTQAEVTAENRLRVDNGLNSPSGVTDVVQTDYDVVSTADDVFIIPDTETITIKRLEAGASGPANIELFYDVNGDGSVLTLIDVIFVDDTSHEKNQVDESFLGDGTAAIRMRRTKRGGGTLLIFGRWRGYY